MLHIDVRSLTIRGHRLSGPMTLLIPPREVHLLRGPNGCGKSLLLDVVCGVHRSSGVDVLLAGHDVRRSDAYGRWLAGLRRMFQTPALPATVTVRQALEKATCRLDEFTAWHAQTSVFLTACGVSTESTIGALSFGQRRAVDLVFTLAAGQYQLLDEPFSGMRASVIPLAAALIGAAAKRGASIIAVDHTADDRPAFFDAAHDWVKSEDIDDTNRNLSRDSVDVVLEALPIINAREVFWKIFKFRIADRCIAEDLEIVLPKGTVVLFEGGNGTGKSTLLRSIARLPQPWPGVAVAFSTDASEDCMLLSPQPPKLIEDVSVIENLGFMLRRFRWYSPGMLNPAFVLLHWLGFDFRHLRKRAEVLSGGEAAMVALVGAALSPCPIMLLDEPFESLAPYTMPRAIILLHTLLAQGKSAVVISHDPVLAAAMDTQSVVRLDPTTPARGQFVGTRLPLVNRR